jgi:signal transduction histidine kinase
MSIKEASPELKQINFGAVINGVLERLKSSETIDNIQFEIDLNDTPGFFSDENIISTVIFNILENAVKYKNSSESKISIKTSHVRDELKIEISDNGMGIEANALDRIFDMYFRGSQYSKGSGLGLYIAQKSVKKLGGRIEVESELLKGSVFSIFLPGHLILMQ